MSTTKRLKEILDRQGITPYQVEKDLRLGKGRLYRRIKDNKPIDTDLLKQIVEKYQLSSVDHFYIVSGKMIDPMPSDYAAEAAVAYAGSKGEYSTASVVEEDWSYVKRMVQKNHALKIFRVVGDSMSPTLYDTDLVFAIPEPNLEDIKQTYIYVVSSSIHESTLIKRVTTRNDGSLLLSSDNREHKNLILNADQVLGLWRVRAYLSWQMGAPVVVGARLLLLEDRLSKLENKL